MRLGVPTTPKNCTARRGISVLEKLVKTCPVWLQLGLSQAEAARILQREVAGVSQSVHPNEDELRMHPTELAACKQLLFALLASLCFSVMAFVWNQQ